MIYSFFYTLSLNNSVGMYSAFQNQQFLKLCFGFVSTHFCHYRLTSLFCLLSKKAQVRLDEKHLGLTVFLPELPCIYLHPSSQKLWPTSMSLLKEMHSHTIMLPPSSFTIYWEMSCHDKNMSISWQWEAPVNDVWILQISYILRIV